MIRFLLPSMIMLAAAAPADMRVRTIDWETDRIVQVAGRIGIETMIMVEAGERIETIAVGNARSWQISPTKRGNIMFVKPVEGALRTNMTVVTNRRQYLFDLVPGRHLSPVYLLRFSYPLPPAAAANPVTQPAPDPPTPSRPLNTAWVRKGDPVLLPTRVFDDGNDTFLEWPPDRELPGIFVRDSGGNEGPVNFTVKDGLVVVSGVSREYVLRLGKAVATLTGNARTSGGQ